MWDVRGDVSSELENSRKGWATVFLLLPGEKHRIYHPSKVQASPEHNQESLYIKWNGTEARVVHIVSEDMLVDPEDSPVHCYHRGQRQQLKRVDVPAGTLSNKPEGISVWSARFTASSSGLIEVHDTRASDIEVYEFRLRDEQTLPRRIDPMAEEGFTASLRGSSFDSPSSDECCAVSIAYGQFELRHQVLLHPDLEFTPRQRYRVLLDGEELMLAGVRKEISLNDGDQVLSTEAMQWQVEHRVEAGQVIEIIDDVSKFREVVNLV